MRCPACGTENPDKAKRCSSCAKRIPRRSRTREAQKGKETSPGQPPGPPKSLDLFAYRVSLFSLIPGLGLVLGLVALLLAGFAWSGQLIHPEGRRRGPLFAAAILGCATLIANLIGVALIIRGLSPGGEP